VERRGSKIYGRASVPGGLLAGLTAVHPIGRVPASSNSDRAAIPDGVLVYLQGVLASSPLSPNEQTICSFLAPCLSVIRRAAFYYCTTCLPKVSGMEDLALTRHSSGIVPLYLSAMARTSLLFLLCHRLSARDASRCVMSTPFIYAVYHWTIRLYLLCYPLECCFAWDIWKARRSGTFCALAPAMLLCLFCRVSRTARLLFMSYLSSFWRGFFAPLTRKTYRSVQRHGIAFGCACMPSPRAARDAGHWSAGSLDAYYEGGHSLLLPLLLSFARRNRVIPAGAPYCRTGPRRCPGLVCMVRNFVRRGVPATLRVPLDGFWFALCCGGQFIGQFSADGRTRVPADVAPAGAVSPPLKHPRRLTSIMYSPPSFYLLLFDVSPSLTPVLRLAWCCLRRHVLFARCGGPWWACGVSLPAPCDMLYNASGGSFCMVSAACATGLPLALSFLPLALYRHTACWTAGFVAGHRLLAL